MRTNHKGFGALQVLLITAICGIIGGVGYFVYNSQKSTNKTLENTAKSASEIAATQKDTKKPDNLTASPKEEESWLLFEPTDKAYSVRVPDGWKAVSLYGNLYNRDPANMAYVKGTKATVEVLEEGGWDGGSPFSLINPGSYASEIVRQGTQAGDIKTSAGLTVHKYIYIQETEPEAIGYAKGTKVYNYYFGAEGKSIQVTHSVAPGQTDYQELVERVIKTITVN